MSRTLIFRPTLLLVAAFGLFLSSYAHRSLAQSPPASRYPLQLEIITPHPPSAFASAGQRHLVYELVLRNFENRTVELQRLGIEDASSSAGATIASFDAAQLPALIRRAGGRTEQPGTMIPAGGSITVYLMLSFDAQQQLPPQLRHRLQTSLGDVVSLPTATQHDTVQTIGAPLSGKQWLAETGLSNDNGHRRGAMLYQGRAVISRRYAFDWVQVDPNGDMHAGAATANAAYYAYGEPLLAVADGVVVSVLDAIPENQPGRAPVVPITLANTTGNHVVLDIGGGQFAHYMHLKDGSLRVKSGDHVQRGQLLGMIGNSGDSFVPHLHFEITTSALPLAGEGVPYVFDEFQVLTDEGNAVMHHDEIPMEKMLVDFGG